MLFHPDLERTRFTIFAEHDTLKRTLNLADATGKLARRQFREFEMDFDIVHSTGIRD